MRETRTFGSRWRGVETGPVATAPLLDPTNSNQKHRWLAAALLDIEPRLRRVRGYRALPQLREALQKERGTGDCQRRRAIAS